MKLPFQRDLDAGMSINIYCALLAIVKCADIIKPCNVVFMLVRKNDSVKVLHFFTQHLVPEVGARIYYDHFFGILYHH